MSEVEKKKIPRSFMKRIKKLGFKEKDAEVLFQTKLDWTAITSDCKIYCVER